MRDFDREVVNKSGNIPFSQIVKNAASRRQVLKAGAATSLVGFMSGSGLRTALAQGDEEEPEPLVGFTPLPRESATGNWLAISEDYEYDVVFPWGDPIQPDGPEFELPMTAENQEKQIGVGHDGMWFFSGDEPDTGILCLNHEFANHHALFGRRTAPYARNREETLVAQHAHGVSVLDVAKVEGVWQVVAGDHARRIHANTPVEFSGPAAQSALLALEVEDMGTDMDSDSDSDSDMSNEVERPPLGTLNNCGSGPTPWQTYLTCEENFQGYFGTRNATWTPSAEQARYGFGRDGFGWRWHYYDSRFNLYREETLTESNRFGWVVEIDPFDPESTPVKRTALGRFKHEGACVTPGQDNRIVVYMGDDQGDEYIYKFVGNGDYISELARCESPLDNGKLYVARFNEDYTGDWLEMTEEDPVLRDSLGSQDRILTYARIAGKLLGATPMDRPEWITIAPNGEVYCALTNNSGRSEANRANPQAPNPDGHIIRLMDEDDHVGTSFTWDIFKLASSTHGTEESFSDPDCVYADPDGRLFILTDGTQQDTMNNQLLVADTTTGEIRRLFSGVRSCEITGITHNAERTEYFVNVQHPGNGNPGVSDFPRIESGFNTPRDATVVIRRKDGGIVGS